MSNEARQHIQTWEQAMPRFFFNVIGKRRIHDRLGLIRRDNAHAIVWAESIAESLQNQDPTATVIVTREGAGEIARVASGDP
jgi:hypothetical protein